VIVLNTINDITKIEYIKALSKLHVPKTYLLHLVTSTIVFAFIKRIPKRIVDELIQNYSYISINEHQIPFRRLVNPDKRFIISNARPIIPRKIINKYLILEGIRELSKITFLKAGFQDELAHISSFHHQVYIPFIHE